MRLAGDAAALHAKVSALGVWLYNRDDLGGFFADGEWLLTALARAEVHRYETGDLDPATARRLSTRMNEQRADREFFSIRPLRQAPEGALQDDGAVVPDSPVASTGC